MKNRPERPPEDVGLIYTAVSNNPKEFRFKFKEEEEILFWYLVVAVVVVVIFISLLLF